MRQNKHCQIYWQILNPEKNVMRNTVLQVRGRKWQLLLGGKTLGIAVHCWRGQGKVQQTRSRCRQKLLMRCGRKFSVRAISNIHAVMNNPKIINLDFLAGKTSAILDLHRDFSNWCISSTFRDNALHTHTQQ